MIVEGIDLGDIAILITLVLGIISVIVVMLWQTGRSDAKADRLDAKFDTKIDALRTETSQKLDTASRGLSQEISAARTELGRRTSDVELAQARQDGVNSVLQNQTHTHETLAD